MNKNSWLSLQAIVLAWLWVLLAVALPALAENVTTLGRSEWNALTEPEKTVYLRGLYDAQRHSQATPQRKTDAPFIPRRQNVFLGALEAAFFGSSRERMALDRMKYEQASRDHQRRQALGKSNAPSLRELNESNTLEHEDLSALREALNIFFADYKNQRIDAPAALGLIVLAMHGATESDVQELTEYLRANPVAVHPDGPTQARREHLVLGEYVTCPTGDACQIRIDNNLSLYHLWEIDAPQADGQCQEEIKQAHELLRVLNDRLKNASMIEIEHNGMVYTRQVVTIFVDGQNLNQWLIENKWVAKLAREHNSSNWCPASTKAKE